MEYEVDYNPQGPEDHFFISVKVNDKEYVSFDHTIKGHRVIKQIVVDNQPFPEDKEPTSEWDDIVIRDGKFLKKYHVRWLDMDKQDWCNDEIWETVAEQSLSAELGEKILYYSRLVGDYYQDLDKVADQIKELETLLAQEKDNFLQSLE